MTDVDPVALGRWLAGNVDGVLSAEVTSLEIISGGASNLTIGVDIAGHQLVVRRPPVGAFLPSANDVSREYRYLSALRDTPVPVPPVHAFCDDVDVIGAPFYVMERLHGIVPHEPEALGGITAEQGRALSQRFVDVLRAIHGVDIDAVGLGDAAKRTGFLERQVSRWTDQWHRAKESDSPVIDELAVELERRRPESPPTTVVHGDYRLGNVMVDAGRTDIIGVFDWEMATLGDPHADVGYTLLWWGTTDRPPIHPSQAVADLPGFLSADDLCRAYGAEASAFDFYIALAAFKLAIIGEGNRARARRLGQEVPGPGPSGRLSGEIENPLPGWALDLITRGT